MSALIYASSTVQRGHRLVLLFLGIIVVLVIIVIAMSRENARIGDSYARLSSQMPVYIVPGSQPGEYLPSRNEMLVGNFSEYIVQNLNSYTHTNLANQYKSVQGFFTPQMLVLADSYYAERITAAQVDEYSSVFLMDRDSLKVKEVPPPSGETGTFYEVTMKGVRKNILGGSMINDVPLSVRLLVTTTFVSRTNPWGFMVARYEEQAQR